jgi:hypothetical protein
MQGDSGYRFICWQVRMNAPARRIYRSVSYDCSVPYFLSPWPGPRIVTPGKGEMDYEFDLHPTHSVIRLTVTVDTLNSAHLCFYRQSSLTAKPVTKTTQKETWKCQRYSKLPPRTTRFTIQL